VVNIKYVIVVGKFIECLPEVLDTTNFSDFFRVHVYSQYDRDNYDTDTCSIITYVYWCAFYKCYTYLSPTYEPDVCRAPPLHSLTGEAYKCTT
jgi:hypothetical protein